MQTNSLLRSNVVTALVFLACGAACNGFVVTLGSIDDDGGTRTGSDGGGGSGDTGVPPRPDASLDARSTDSGPRGDADDAATPGSDAGAPECPAAAPAAGASCTDLGEECEYGSSAATSCNKIYKCESTGWQTEPATTLCPVSSCPAAYGAVEAGAACAPSGATCGYAQGTCTCAPPVPATTPSKPDEWQCFPEQAGCPSPRPKLGSPCVATASTSCNYGACADGEELVCRGGIWVTTSVGCPT